MRRWACRTSAFFTLILLTRVSFAQFVSQPQPAQLQAFPSIPASIPIDANAKAEKEKQERARHQTALAMLDVVLAGTRNLSLPQNRIAIASEAFPLLWSRNEAQARALVNQMIGDFSQASSHPAENSRPNPRLMLRQQRQMVVREIANVDPGLALSFMNATRTYVQIGNPEQEEAEERALRLELAAEEAARNPRNALRMAEKELRSPGPLPEELINLLSQVTAKDPEAGAQLLHEIVGRVRGADLSSGDEDFTFAVNLLTAQMSGSPDGAPPDAGLKTLADAIAAAAMNPEFPETQLSTLEPALPAFAQLVPGRVQALRQKVQQSAQAETPQQASQDQFSEAQASGDPNQMLAAAEQAPSDVRANMYQQVAWQLANNGDLQRARQVAEKLNDAFQRDQVVQQALRQSASIAANQGEFATARQLAEEVNPEEDRATMLAQFASTAAAAKHEKLAQEMLEEAGSLLLNRSAGATVFAAQLQVAQAFARVKPARAIPLLERSASQLEQVLSAAAEVDAFFTFQRSFEGGELLLTNSFVSNSLIRPYAEATAELADTDLATARILADRLSLPEARLLAELFVARSALGEPPAQESTVFGAPGLVVQLQR